MSEAKEVSRFVLVIVFGGEKDEGADLLPFDLKAGYVSIMGGISCPRCPITSVGRVSTMELARDGAEACTAVEGLKVAKLLTFSTEAAAQDWVDKNRSRFDVVMYLG